MLSNLEVIANTAQDNLVMANPDRVEVLNERSHPVNAGNSDLNDDGVSRENPTTKGR